MGKAETPLTQGETKIQRGKYAIGVPQCQGGVSTRPWAPCMCPPDLCLINLISILPRPQGACPTPISASLRTKVPTKECGPPETGPVVWAAEVELGLALSGSQVARLLHPLAHPTHSHHLIHPDTNGCTAWQPVELLKHHPRPYLLTGGNLI